MRRVIFKLQNAFAVRVYDERISDKRAVQKAKLILKNSYFDDIITEIGVEKTEGAGPTMTRTCKIMKT